MSRVAQVIEAWPEGATIPLAEIAHWSGLSEDATLREIALLVLADAGRTMRPEPEHVKALAELQAEDE